MESACSCYVDLEPICPYTHLTPRARKEHTCDECGGMIKKGEQYHIHKGRCDGDWMQVKNCEQCETIRDDYGCGCIGGLDEAVYECLGIHINALPEEDE